MSKKYEREKIGEIVQKITELNMSYVDGAKQFNIPDSGISLKAAEPACSPDVFSGNNG